MSVAAIQSPSSAAASPQRRQAVTWTLVLACLVSVIAAVCIGAMSLSPWSILSVDAEHKIARIVLLEIRAPRVLLAASVGIALALSGAVLQGLFRNPLADPGLIGISGGAALGAVALIVLGAPLALSQTIGPYALPLAALTGAVVVTGLLYVFARHGRFAVATILLAGIAINALAMAGIGVFTYISDDVQMRTLTFWMMGSFGRVTWATVAPAVALMALAVALLLRQYKALDLLQLGESPARHLGVNLRGLRRSTVLGVGAAVGAAVALSGIIGFVGLVVPHLVRMLGGASHRYVLPCSALLGATLMVVADLIARTILSPIDLPVGLVTSALGSPFFLCLIARMRART